MLTRKPLLPVLADILIILAPKGVPLLRYPSKEISKFLFEVEEDATAGRQSSSRGPFHYFTLSAATTGLIASRHTDSIADSPNARSQQSCSPASYQAVTPMLRPCDTTADSDCAGILSWDGNLSTPQPEVKAGDDETVTKRAYDSHGADAYASAAIACSPSPQRALETCAFASPIIDILLHHYTIGIGNILQPIVHANNPWHKLHYPAILEIALVESMSSSHSLDKSSEALYHGALATAALHLWYCNKKPLAKYLRLGNLHRHKAILALQTAINEPIYATKYSTLLMAIGTLITIGVSSNTLVK